ncbi:MAG: hypothetical protein Q9201_001398 [Fulgogasparrea decipioides]
MSGVPGFTPIDPSLLTFLAPITPTPVTEPAPNGANNGKKRQRKRSAPTPAIPKPTKAACPKPSKKAKQTPILKDQAASDESSIIRPHDRTTSRYLTSGAARRKSVASNSSGPSKKTTNLSNSKVILESPSTNGLWLNYQAAFKGEAQQLTIERQDALLLPNQTTDPYTQEILDSLLSEPISSSTIVGDRRPGLRDPHGYGGQDAKNVSERSNAVSVCQVPCSQGVLLDSKDPEHLVGHNPALRDPVPYWYSHLSEPNADDSPKVTTLTVGFPPLASGNAHLNGCHSQDGQGPFHTGRDDVGLPDLDGFPCRDPQNAHSSMDAHRLEASISVSGHANDWNRVTKRLSGLTDNPIDHSCLSNLDLDLLMSFTDDHTVNLSSSPYLESASPYLQSPNFQNPRNRSEASARPFVSNCQIDEEEIYNDQDIETVLLELQTPTSTQIPSPSPPISPDQARILKSHFVLSSTVTPASSPVKSVSLSTAGTASPAPTSLEQRSSTPHDIQYRISFDHTGAPVPFVRPPFPAPIRDRSPILGLNTRTVLRTCFRIGEALNAGSTALRTNTDAIIELYARVLHSERSAGSVKQHFHFMDVFSPDKPPYLKGSYGLWRGNRLWDEDSKVFLGEGGKGKMARVTGRLTREDMGRGVELRILSVWEAAWDDVETCKGHFFYR